MYDEAEIPHLFDSENMSIYNDLYILENAKSYIKENGNIELYVHLQKTIAENTIKLYQL